MLGLIIALLAIGCVSIWIYEACRKPLPKEKEDTDVGRAAEKGHFEGHWH